MVAGLLVAVAAAGLPACVIYDSPATASIEWDFGGLGCGEAGVHTVTVEIEAYDEDFYDVFDVDCLAGGVILEDLTPGDYFLHLDGRGGAQLWHTAADVELHAGENEFLVHLDPIGSH